MINTIFEVVTANKTFHLHMADLEFSELYIGEHHSPNTREELQGLPRLNGFCGPMFNGYDTDGKAKIRYESKEVYDSIAFD